MQYNTNQQLTIEKFSTTNTKDAVQSMKDNGTNKKKKRRRLKGGMHQKLEEVNELSPNVDDETTTYARIDDEENDPEEVTNEVEEVQENSSRSTELDEGLDTEDIEQRPTEMLEMVETMKNRPNLINEVGLKTFRFLAFFDYLLFPS